MEEAETQLPLRSGPEKDWRWQDNEASNAFLPIIGLATFGLYCHLTGLGFGKQFKYTLRGLAMDTKSASTTIWRAMAVLERIGLVRIRHGGGSQPSACSLIDLKKLAAQIGGTYDKKRASFVLKSHRIEELRNEVKALLVELQAKRGAKQNSRPSKSDKPPHVSGGGLLSHVSKRDASVSPERRQHSTRETQMGPHLIREERRIENVLSPTPSLECQPSNPKSPSSEDERQELLKWVRDRFIGVIADMGAHLLETNRPSSPHLANGLAEWKKFGFNSLAVEAAEWRGKVLVMILSASDASEARRGLEKYSRVWNSSLRKWFGCKVSVQVEPAPSKR
jgi:hypothetical protein